MSEEIKEISTPILARVEGEGALSLSIKNNQITSLQLKIYEPPRLFEKFLEGREPNEVIDAVARICGICPVAYQMSAVQALEQIFKLTPSPWVREMRRLFYCGEWIESHCIHIHMLAAPDFYRCTSVLELAKTHPELVNRGTQLHTLGRELMTLLGRRSVHPVGACVGGFYYAPTKEEVSRVLDQFQQHLHLARELIEWASTLSFPSYEQDFISVALSHPSEYAINEGKITSDHGLSIDARDFEAYFQEKQVPYSTAFHCQLQGKAYLVGPLARVNLNAAHFPAEVKSFIETLPIHFPSKNMFHSILARAIEIYYAMLEAIRIMRGYISPAASTLTYKPCAGVGFGATEAPRGLLWHRYQCAEDGLIETANIVPPTSQNQGRIEQDLKVSLEAFGLSATENNLRFEAEKIIRNYDPCISCSTHFLTLKVNHG